MTIVYEISTPADEEMVAVCDDGARGFQQLLVQSTKLTLGRPASMMMWFLSRFYRRKITDTSIEYNFYLLSMLVKGNRNER